MKIAQLSQHRLAELIGRFPACRIAVVGDFFLDKYLEVDPALEEPSLETGKPAHQVVGVRTSPGAAGTVTGNLAALGCGRLHAVGFIGDDGEGYELRKGLAALRCDTRHLQIVADRHTPTYLKPRNFKDHSLRGEHSRYDTKNRITTTREMEGVIIQAVETLLPNVDAVMVMDQVEEPDCGVVTARVREALADMAGRHPRTFFWADSRRHIRLFRKLIIKPNQFEALGIEDPAPGAEVDLAELEAAVRRLRAEVGAPVVVTRGARGMAVTDPEWTLARGVAVEGETDPTGAGDSVSAGVVLALCAGATLPEAAVVGNLVASITVQQIGTTGTAQPGQLPGRLALWARQQGG